MSNNIFADPKTALGFAGVTIAFAVVAALSAEAFLPSSDDDTAPSGPIGGEVTANTPSAAPRETAAWADEGLSDDWSGDSLDDGSDEGGWASGPSSRELDPDFEEYVPDRRENSAPGPGPSRQARSRPPRGRVPSSVPRDGTALIDPAGGRGEGTQIATRSEG